MTSRATVTSRMIMTARDTSLLLTGTLTSYKQLCSVVDTLFHGLATVRPTPKVWEIECAKRRGKETCVESSQIELYWFNFFKVVACSFISFPPMFTSRPFRSNISPRYSLVNRARNLNTVQVGSRSQFCARLLLAHSEALMKRSSQTFQRRSISRNWLGVQIQHRWLFRTINLELIRGSHMRPLSFIETQTKQKKIFYLVGYIASSMYVSDTVLPK